MTRFRRLLPLLLLLGGPQAHGHGDVHEAIADLSLKLQANPQDVRLLVERAALYTADNHLEEALADVMAAASHEPANAAAMALRGAILFRMNRYSDAKIQQEACLKLHPANARVRFDYCQTLAALEQHDDALRELDALIAATPSPSPDVLMMRIRVAEGRDAQGPAQALAWLQTMLAKHPLPVLQDEALRLEIKLGHTADAMRRMDALISQSPRPEFLLVRKAELLKAAKDNLGAKSATAAAEEAIAKLPANLRRNSALEDLLRRIHLLKSGE
jgi:predicted Zn-dependent protease